MSAGKAGRGATDDSPRAADTRVRSEYRVSPRREQAPVSPGGELEHGVALVAKDPDSVPDGSPALYRTDRKSWIVRGWAVTDPAALAALNLPEGETCVEIPDRLVPYFQTRP